jgi:hypothetical protein
VTVNKHKYQLATAGVLLCFIVAFTALVSAVMNLRVLQNVGEFLG